MPTCPFAPVLRLPENTVGRDFVVGDIYGAFDLVEQALEQVRFDPARDRLFSVGDLIDRGPNSHEVVAFLARPGIHAVCGNHEAMLLDLYENGDPSPEALHYVTGKNGFGWWLVTPDDVRQDILGALRNLPVVIETRTRRGTVGFVHADVPAGMDWPTFTRRLERDDDAVLETALWGRRRVAAADGHGVTGIGRVFVGHSPQWNGIARLGNVYLVDTGGVFALLGRHPEGRLTLAETVMETGALLAPTLPQLVDVRFGDCPPVIPFGNYATSRSAATLAHAC